MVASEFLSQLEAVREMFEWRLVQGARPGIERRSRPRLHIRAVCKFGPPEFLFDPIAAVCYIRTGKLCAEDAWLDAANAIEFSLIDAGDFVAAANDRVWVDAGERRVSQPYLQQLRTRLAASVSLNLPSVSYTHLTLPTILRV